MGGQVYSRNARRHYGYRKKPSDKRPPVIRITAYIFIVCMICAVRFSDTPQAVEAREWINSLIEKDADYKGAVEVIGRAFLRNDEENSTGESALTVFGRKVLGLEDEEPEALDEPETVEAIIENDKLSDMTGAGRSGHAFETQSAVAEAPLPVMRISFRQNPLAWDEENDDTPNEPFKIPAPDIVDTGAYALPFEYAIPVNGAVTSHFGYRIHPISGNTTFHYGVDLRAAIGKRIGAFAAGKVSETGYGRIYGNYVRLEHADGYTSFYAHLNKISVKKGEKLSMGDKVGEAGSTGYSTGSHLHFELRRNGLILDPEPYISASGG
ncbi:MAG: M23 family metallopeptidase [Clostridia bacterium]|nr:M23 family metallopeptidase [Clostridia bacterium]